MLLVKNRAAKPKKQKPLRDLVTGKILPSETITEEEFLNWITDKVRAEWVDGRVVLISPVKVEHEELLIFFIRVLASVVDEDDLGTILASEVLVRFAAQRRQRMPDIRFIAKARRSIIKEAVIDGAPDLILEIVSKDSVAWDYRDKYADYEKAGVKEYWIVDPLSRKVEVHVLRAKKYRRVKELDGWVRSTVIPKFAIQPDRLWKRPLPNFLDTLRELDVKF
jgi:Uma2 family endonuclease